MVLPEPGNGEFSRNGHKDDWALCNGLHYLVKGAIAANEYQVGETVFQGSLCQFCCVVGARSEMELKVKLFEFFEY